MTTEQPEQPQNATDQPQAEQAEQGNKTVKYVGPDGQVNLDVGKPLVNGESYELPAELADHLVASSVHWEAEGS